jgi:D-alanyl-D-alanine carboxypeptidase
MAWGTARRGLRYCLLAFAPVAAALVSTSDLSHAESYSPPTASIVVDGNSGAVLQASNPDALRHPASLTKTMTLYLLFERLEAGKIKLDSQLNVSEYASEQAPTKLGLKPGQTIVVGDAIKAIVTKSANDAAVAVAENLGGDEGHFAKLMTQKARDLGMTRTTYTNASGLPDDDQVTTSRDQALLGRLIQKRFPRYYRYFSTESFVYHGEMMRNHNHLLGSIEGVDGIKSGFTRASGFNLVTSVHRDGRYIVAVVMGGRSSLERDAHMRELISAHIKETALKPATPAIAKSNRRNETQPALAYLPVASQGNPLDPIEPLSALRRKFKHDEERRL